MKRHLLLATPLFLLLLVSLNMLNAFAVSANQLGASTIIATCPSYNWAGVAYSAVTHQLYVNRPGAQLVWAAVPWVNETIYVGNLTLVYYGITDPNIIGIWVGLSPAQIGPNYMPGSSTSGVENTFVQAGYGLIVYSNGTAEIQYFVMVLVGGNLYSKFTALVPAGPINYLNVYLRNFFNGTALAKFYVKYANGSYWTKSVYVSIPFEWTASALSIVEAPLVTANNKGFLAELPMVFGGMIHFSFGYIISNGTEYVGPGNIPQGVAILAVVFNLSKQSATNVAQAWITDGWANSAGGWDYLYQFDYLGYETTGL